MNQQAIQQNLNDAQKALLLAQTLEYNGLPQIVSSPNKIGLAGSQSDSLIPSIDTLIGGLGQLVSPGPGFDTVNRLGEAAVVDEEDEQTSGLPKPGTIQHAVTLGAFRLQQGLNQLAQKLSQPESLLSEVGQFGYSLLTGQPVADNKIGQAADSVSYSSISNINPTSVALGVLATGRYLHAHSFITLSKNYLKGCRNITAVSCISKVTV